MTALKAFNLKKRYKSREVVKDVSLEVNSGEIVGLLGPNGAGKTTSFYMIVGLVSPNSGGVLLDSQNITHLAMHQRARLGIGYLPQERSIFTKLSVADNIRAILQLNARLSNTERKTKLEQLLEEFHITHLRGVIAASLSGGETRRVEIARALAANPKFILLDEPFAGIDPISVIDIKNIIQQLCHKGIGVLITDHNVRETLDICERGYIVSEGSIIANGNASAILANQKVREVYLGESFEIYYQPKEEKMMDIHIQGNKVEVTDAIQDYINKKMKRLKNYSSFITSVEIILHIDKHNHIAEAQISIPGNTLHAKANAQDMYAALDVLADRITRQLNKHKEKITDHHE